MSSVLYYGSSTQIHSGAAQWMYRLADNMRDYGYGTVAVLPSQGGIAMQYEDSEIQTEYLYSEPIRLRRSVLGHLLFILRSLIVVIQLILLIRRTDIDVVHVNEVTYPQGLVAGRLGGARVVCHVRASFNSRFIRTALSYAVVLFAHEIVCVSERTREQMFEEIGVNTDSVSVIYDGVPSPNRFDSLPDGTEFREEIGVSNEQFLVVQVSKLILIKGQERLIEAAKRLSKRHTDMTFAIVGGEVEGHEEYAENLRTQAAEVNSVEMVGFYPDIVEALAAADVVVHVPEYEDPFPGVVLEGMLAGLPVVGARTGGIPEQIEENKTGLLVPATNAPSEIAEAIEQLYTDPATREEMGEYAFDRIRSRFPPENHFKSMSEVYERMLSSR
jgi:glycosyltransferase involved in cell wall biosynthesis